jgi:hypothetical protein
MSPFERSTTPIYLTPEVISKATYLFGEAERLVADDPDRLTRVQTARLSLDYAKLHVASRLNAFLRPDEKEIPAGEYFRYAMDKFFTTAERAGVGYVREASRSHSAMKEFREDLEQSVNIMEGLGGQGE